MSPDNRPIGFLDSGVGGLSLLNAARRLLPQESMVMLADDRCFPYGTMAPSEVIDRATQATAHLVSLNVKLVVVACNTASVHALAHLRATFPSLPFVGVVPVVKTLAQQTRTGTIAVLSTPSTAESAYMADLVQQFAPDKQVVNVACAGLADLIEAGNTRSGRARALLDRYLADVRTSDADVLGLGCTHYLFLRGRIQRLLGKAVRVYDPALPVARRIRQVLTERDALACNLSPSYRFYSTGDFQRFQTVARKLLAAQARDLQSIQGKSVDLAWSGSHAGISPAWL